MRRRDKIAPLQTASIHSRVWPLDLDANLHMNNGRYLSIMDLGRLDLMVKVGVVPEVIKRKWMPVLSAATIRYRLPLNPFQRFRLDTKIVWWDEKWFYIEQRFVIIGGDKDGAVAAIAFVKGSLFDSKAKKTVPSQDLIDLIGGVEPVSKPSYIESWQQSESDMRNLTKL
jgi:acyl-CoA thioesterase FadM